MRYNYFISYDLNSPGQDYSKIANKIAGLGASIRCQRSMFYLRSQYTKEQVATAVQSATDLNDSLLVILANDATMINLLPGATEFIQKHWNS